MQITLSISGRLISGRVIQVKVIEQISTLIKVCCEWESDLVWRVDELVSLSAELRIHGQFGRIIHGVITEAECRCISGWRYRMTIESMMTKLKSRKDRRIYQQQSVVDIGQQILHQFELPAANTHALCAAYSPRNYIVQFDESYYDFIRRILSHAGVFFYQDLFGDVQFADKNVASAATLILAKDIKSTQTFCVFDWEPSYQYQPVDIQLIDVDFLAPNNPIIAAEKQTNLLKTFYPAGVQNLREAQAMLVLEQQRLAAKSQVIYAGSQCPILFAGRDFQLAGSHYFITRVMHHWQNHGGDFIYRNTFQCIPFSQRFVPEKLPKPRMQYTQTAVVTGPSGVEQYTDQYGRIKVQFQWDKYGKYNENSTCWLPLAQFSAGEDGGVFFTPRIGEEVIVQYFCEDPDRPVVIGSVNNAQHPLIYPTEQRINRYGIREKLINQDLCHEIVFDDTVTHPIMQWYTPGDFHCAVAGSYQQTIQGEYHVEVEKKYTTEIQQGSFTVEAANQLILQAGDSKIVLSADGLDVSAKRIDLQTNA